MRVLRPNCSKRPPANTHNWLCAAHSLRHTMCCIHFAAYSLRYTVCRIQSADTLYGNLIAFAHCSPAFPLHQKTPAFAALAQATRQAPSLCSGRPPGHSLASFATWTRPLKQWAPIGLASSPAARGAPLAAPQAAQSQPDVLHECVCPPPFSVRAWGAARATQPLETVCGHLPVPKLRPKPKL